VRNRRHIIRVRAFKEFGRIVQHRSPGDRSPPAESRGRAGGAEAHLVLNFKQLHNSVSSTPQFYLELHSFILCRTVQCTLKSRDLGGVNVGSRV